jgi:AbrB family looped-hinge helix DNA binding protein
MQAKSKTSSKISGKYQIAIPKKVRDTMGLQVGEQVAVYAVDERRAVIARQPASYVQAMKGLGKDAWKKAGGAVQYIKKERKAWEKK